MNKSAARHDLSPAVLTTPGHGSGPRRDLRPLATISSRLLAAALTRVTGRWLAALASLALATSASAATGITVLPAPPDSGPVTVFYPTTATPARYQRGPFVFQLASDASPARGNGHLIVVSHGSGGSPWPQADLAMALVDAGFTVAMPEHAGDNFHDMSRVGPVSWEHRPKEVSQAIDAMAADARFASRLDFQHVGMYGMSAGGHTALTLAGGRWSPARLAQHCEAHLADDFPACVGLATELTGSSLDALRLSVAREVIHRKFDDQTAPREWNEPRITAIVATVPAATTFDMSTLAQPRVPLGLVRAGKDEWLKPQWHIDAVRAACKLCTLVADMTTAGHGSTLSPMPPDLPPRAARLINDPPGFDRATLPAIYAAITGFFLQNLLP
ncbi:dienelactone hydrolase [Variovorax sp. dw_308]|uniref:alpha/beta hydrolase family protein n=1 Tax=Variovorax sp. dw_308 TaxID=2721546 RepID=UPI00210A9CA1|nr:dienelactone hydrolase [Variovorax sp. dw_308]